VAEADELDLDLDGPVGVVRCGEQVDGGQGLPVAGEPSRLGEGRTANRDQVVADPERLPGGRRPFFVHIMKTGGTSFRAALADHLGPQRLYPNPVDDVDVAAAAYRIDRLLGLDPDRLARIAAFSGHFPFVVTELLGLDLLTITLLRDPVDRTLSHLRHRRRHHPPSAAMPLEAIYEDPMFRPMLLDNLQTKVFAMRADDKLESFMDVVPIDEGRYRTACDHLDAVDVVGVLEGYGAFLERVEAATGIRCTVHHHRHGVPPGGDAPEAFRRRIAEDNAYDVALYEHAASLAGRSR
jgi:hypothetical protein